MSKSKFILFNPSSPKPPKKIWDSFDAAKKTAAWAANQSPGETYLVCEVRNVTIVKNKETKSTNIPAYDSSE